MPTPWTETSAESFVRPDCGQRLSRSPRTCSSASAVRLEQDRSDRTRVRRSRRRFARLPPAEPWRSRPGATRHPRYGARGVVVALPPSGLSSRIIVGGGTPESEWEAAAALGTLTPLDVRPCTRAVVLSPHPDDETLGIGGLISSLVMAEVPVTVIAATDGEASHPRSSLVIREILRRRRPAEARAALSTLGAGKPPEVVRLALPDGELSRFEQVLAEHVSQLLRPGDWCFATWERDGHPDHEAVARSTRVACNRVGARLVSYPIWMWHWATPADAQLPWSRARRIPLSPQAMRRKALAVDCFRSQIRPLSPTDPAILSPNDLAHFHRSFEMVIV